MTPVGPLVIAARLSFVLVVALTFQLGIAGQLQLFGVQGDIMLLIAVAAGLSSGPERGATIGFATGIAYDLLLQTPFGLSALTYAIVGYVIGSMQDTVLRAAWWIPVTTAVIGSLFGVILYGVVGTMVGEDLLQLELLRVAAVVAVLNAVAAPVMMRAVRWATASGAARGRALLR